MKVLVVTGCGGSAGFRLAGLETRELAPDEVSSFMLELLAEGVYGIVIVEERLYTEISGQVMKRIEKKGLPMVVPVMVPRSWEETGPVESRAVRLIRKAIGYQIKIKRR